MAANIITQEDLHAFKKELIDEITELFQRRYTEQKLWLRTGEVREMLNISPGTLQNLRINGTLRTTKIGRILYYNYKDIETLFNKSK